MTRWCVSDSDHLCPGLSLHRLRGWCRGISGEYAEIWDERPESVTRTRGEMWVWAPCVHWTLGFHSPLLLHSNDDVSKVSYTMRSHLCFKSPHTLYCPDCCSLGMIDITQISCVLINTLVPSSGVWSEVCLLRHYYRNQSQGSPALITNQFISLFMVNEWSLISESC